MPPPDQDQRRQIVEQLDKTMLVEAAAGTGKTTGMLDRMVALIAEGHCQVETLAAVTFTRKTAAELRSRFQVRLERAARESGGTARERLSIAVSHLERCFIGTIHSFCARLLRERPIEAGVDLAFQSLEVPDDLAMREAAWKESVEGWIGNDDPRLDQLIQLDLQVDQLGNAFISFADYPDVQEWDAAEVELPDWELNLRALEEYVEHMNLLIPTFPADRGTDKMMGRYEQIARLARNRDLTSTPRLMEILELFVPSMRPVQYCWPGDNELAAAEQQRWQTFVQEVTEPLKEKWRARRYQLVINLLTDAAENYNQLREADGGLNFQDLLMKTADLLRDKPQVRRYFRNRFTHLLVDEFQDTDPIQAEVMMFLTASDPAEQNWTRCQPVPGSLFVVGDPKQSIYRFTRADILTYEKVKAQILEHGGVVVSLTANFRTRKDLVEWGNGIFGREFPEVADHYAAASSEMKVARSEGSDGESTGIHILRIPAEYSDTEEIVDFEADFVARTIRHALDSKVTVPRTQDELDRGLSPQVTPGDFLIVTWRKWVLARYGQKLQELGIPYQVSGGSALSQVSQLDSLVKCLRAVNEPDNPVALVALLRSQLFGVNDEELFAFREQKGRFSYQATVPDAMSPQTSQRFQAAFERLRCYNQWLRRLPPLPAMERIAGDLGLTLQALTEIGGDVQAGSICKAMEMLRDQQAELPSAGELIDYLDQLIESEAEFDGLPARAYTDPVVRLMNLHKVKGLEAPIVFLTGAVGKSSPPASLHIDRSTDQVRGYLAFFGQSSGRGKGPLLACPLDWKSLQKEEKRFLDAERKRLFYVAATRAGTQLIISQKEEKNSYSPWSFFEDDLHDFPQLPDPGEQTAPPVVETELSLQTVEQAAEKIAERWQHATDRTYTTGAAKAMSMEAATGSTGSDGNGSGPAWGTVIHALLETAMRHPEANLKKLAYTLLRQEELPGERVDEAISVVQSVVKSDIWQRALASEKRLVEVPFEHRLPADASEQGVPTLVRGVIDLMFEEPDGWVIVDYKTDAVTVDSVDRLVDHYRGQVNGYADTWQVLTGEHVKEKGLYLTRLDQFVTVD